MNPPPRGSLTPKFLFKSLSGPNTILFGGYSNSWGAPP